MSQQITKVRCNKTLVNDAGEQNFTEGNTYQGKRTNILNNLNVQDDQDDPHVLGNWFKHFTIIPEYNNFR